MSREVSEQFDSNPEPGSAAGANQSIQLAHLLRKLLEDFRCGTLLARALMTKGRLSRRTVAALAREAGLSFSWNALLGDPRLYPLWRELKFAVEGITLCKKEVAAQHGDLIAAVKTYLADRPAVGASSEIFLQDAKGRVLYPQVTALAHAPMIWQLVGLDRGRCNYDYWSDADLVERAASYPSFTALKYGDDALHRSIKGRMLERKLLQANPMMVNHFYMAASGQVCRSLAEVVVNNYLHLCSVAHDWEPRLDICLRGSKRPMVPDARLHERDLYVECAQNLRDDRGPRRKHYAKRIEGKVQAYERAGLRVVVVDSDSFTVRGVLDVAEFAEHFRQEVRAKGLDIGAPPEPAALMQTTHALLLTRLIRGDRSAVMACLDELGIDGIAVLQNHHAHVLTCLKVRDDCQSILDEIKARSNIRRWGHSG